MFRRKISGSEQGVVHHDGMVFGDEFFIGHAVGEAGRTFPDAVVPRVATPGLHLNEVVGLKNLIFVIDAEIYLKRVVRVVSQLEINVVVCERRTAGEWDLAVDVRKNVEAVTITFGDRQRRMQSHPVQKIAKLTKPAADTFFDLSVVENEPFEKAFRYRRPSNHSPDRK